MSNIRNLRGSISISCPQCGNISTISEPFVHLNPEQAAHGQEGVTMAKCGNCGYTIKSKLILEVT